MRQRLRAFARRAVVVLALGFGAAALVTVASWLFSTAEATAEPAAEPSPLGDVVAGLSQAVPDPVESPLRRVSQAAVPRAATAVLKPVRDTVDESLHAVAEPVDAVSGLVARADRAPDTTGRPAADPQPEVARTAPKPPPDARPRPAPRPEPGRHSPAPAPPLEQHETTGLSGPDAPAPAPPGPGKPAPAPPAHLGCSAGGHLNDLGTPGAKRPPSPFADAMPGGRLPAAPAAEHPVHAQPGVTPD